ncbi:MAG: AraC family transcriptional regulator ligand-binding domain-containing protein [Sphingomonas sp.]
MTKRHPGHAAAVAPFDAVHAPLLARFPELVDGLGGDAAALIARGGPDRGYGGIADLLERAAAALDCPDLGMRLAVLQGGVGLFGPLGQAMRRAATFGDALAYVTGHAYAHSLAARIWSRRLRGGALFVGHDVLLEGIAGRRQLVELMLLGGHLAAHALTDGRARARGVAFRHHPLLPVAAYRRYFGCPVAFGKRADGVLFHDTDLAAPVAGADAAAFAAADAAIEARFTRHHPPLQAEVRGVVMRLIGGPDCTNARVAAELTLHPRTLLRRLTEEGTTFHRVKDEVRRDLALYYLERTDLDLSRISEGLGFAEQSVLSRRCRCWFADTPSAVRARGRHPDDRVCRKASSRSAPRRATP